MPSEVAAAPNTSSSSSSMPRRRRRDRPRRKRHPGGRRPQGCPCRGCRAWRSRCLPRSEPRWGPQPEPPVGASVGFWWALSGLRSERARWADARVCRGCGRSLCRGFRGGFGRRLCRGFGGSLCRGFRGVQWGPRSGLPWGPPSGLPWGPRSAVGWTCRSAGQVARALLVRAMGQVRIAEPLGRPGGGRIDVERVVVAAGLDQDSVDADGRAPVEGLPETPEMVISPHVPFAGIPLIFSSSDQVWVPPYTPSRSAQVGLLSSLPSPSMSAGR